MAKEEKKHFVQLSVNEVGIVGGADALPEAERGPLDTKTDKSHPLYDERLKKVKMTPEWVANIDANGIINAVEVVYLNPETGANDPKGVPYMVDGRERIRGGRLVAKKHGKDVLVWCRVTVLDAKGMLKHMNAGNVRHDDSTSVRIAKAKRMLASGIPEAEVAVDFGIKLPTLQVWMQYDKTAIKAVKEAVDKGLIPAVTGFDIARSGNAEVQEEALKAVLALSKRGKKPAKDSDGDDGDDDDNDTPDKPQRTGQSHAAKRAIARAKGERPHVLDKRTLKKLLKAVRAHKLPAKVDDRTAGYWAATEDVLCFILGADPSKEIETLDAMLVAIDAELCGNAPEPTKSTPEPDTEVDEDEDETPTPEPAPKKLTVRQKQLLDAKKAAEEQAAEEAKGAKGGKKK